MFLETILAYLLMWPLASGGFHVEAYESLSAVCAAQKELSQTTAFKLTVKPSINLYAINCSGPCPEPPREVSVKQIRCAWQPEQQAIKMLPGYWYETTE